MQTWGEINDLLENYEQQIDGSETTPRTIGKFMLAFMVRGLFIPLKFPYEQFPAANAKEADMYPLVCQAIKHFTRLGLVVATIKCDGVSDNCRMFTTFNAKSDLPYKLLVLMEEVYSLFPILPIS